MTREELQAIDQALNDAIQQLRVGHLGTSVHCISGAQAIVRAELQREDRMWDRVRTAIQENDEAQASFGGDQTPVPSHLPTLCHDYAPPEHIAPFCAGLSDEPPSRPA